MTLAIDIVGWCAMLLILLAYGLLSAGRLAADTNAFQIMNVVGAAGFIVNSGWYGAYPSATLNVAWMGIGLFALWRQRGRPRTG